jgi:large subunit ribosomal protein L15
MQIHEVQPKTKIQKKKRIGRGGKRGTYSGKGIKGQKSRAGAKMKPIVRELLKRYPKLRGHNFSPLSKSVAINVSVLDKVFEDGAVIEPKTLSLKGLLRKGKKPAVKILGNGKTDKKFYVKGCMISKSAKEIVEKAGGKVTEVKIIEKKEKKSAEPKIVKEKKVVGKKIVKEKKVVETKIVKEKKKTSPKKKK